MHKDIATKDFAAAIMRKADEIRELMEEYNMIVDTPLMSFQLSMTDDGKLTSFISYHTITDMPYKSIKVFEAERGTWREDDPLIILVSPEGKNEEN